MVFCHFSLLLFFRRNEGRGWVNYEDQRGVTFERIFHMTTERDIKNQIEYARDEGLEKGRQEGAREHALQTAQSLLELGVAIDIIAKGIGLSEEDVEALRQS